MTDKLQETIHCPGCNATGPFTLYRSLNVTLNPTEKESLMAGDLFRFKCPSCGRATQVMYPMLYHDMQRKLMIWLLPDDNDDDLRGSPPVPPGMPEGDALAGYKFRSVGSVNELLEKILVFDFDLDDLALEMVKIVIATQLEGAGHPKDAKIHFARAERDEAGAEQLVFAIMTPTGARAAMVPQGDMYANMTAAADELASRHPPPGKWPRIDAEYLNRLMELNVSGGPPS
jgi:hypothetical protein